MKNIIRDILVNLIWNEIYTLWSENISTFFYKTKNKKNSSCFLYKKKKTEIDILNRMILITSMLIIYLHDYIMISFMFSNEVVKIKG
jgi:hypothetical protein